MNYRIIIVVQDGEMKSECDKLYDGVDNYNTVFSDFNGEAVIDYLKDWDDGYSGEITKEEPYWVNNGTDYIHEKDGYTLLVNNTLGGVYMLYTIINEDI